MNDTISSGQNRPPRDILTDNEDAVQSAVTGAAAASADLWAGYTAHPVTGFKTPEGKCWLEVEAVATDAYIRFTRTATVATTTANGVTIKVGEKYRFVVDPAKDLFLDHLSTGAGLIKWRRVGHIVQRGRQ